MCSLMWHFNDKDISCEITFSFTCVTGPSVTFTRDGLNSMIISTSSLHLSPTNVSMTMRSKILSIISLLNVGSHKWKRLNTIQLITLWQIYSICWNDTRLLNNLIIQNRIKLLMNPTNLQTRRIS